MKILVINSGSSSLKFQIINMPDEFVLAQGKCEKIGSGSGIVSYENYNGNKKSFSVKLKNHNDAFIVAKNLILDKEYGVLSELNEICAVGHRVLQGGDFVKSKLVDKKIMKKIADLIPIVPLHNGANLQGIKACQKILGKKVPQVAVFDTAFHATLPPKAYIYPIPYEFYKKYGIRKYGYHGLSHYYVSRECAKLLNKDVKNTKIISCHIGNGASITAISGGNSVDTTMGFTPADGIIMGTRSGSLDPGIVKFICEKENLSLSEFDNIVNKKSGLIGVSGVSNDVRDIFKEVKIGNERALLAQEILCYQVMKTIASYVAVLDGCDAIVFTGGIGENRFDYRKSICNALSFMKIKIDDKLNESAIEDKKVEISTKDSYIKIFVIPTNEEIVIARETAAVVSNLIVSDR